MKKLLAGPITQETWGHVNELKGLIDWLESKERRWDGAQKGSLIILIACPTLVALNDLWDLYRTGELAQTFQAPMENCMSLSQFNVKSVILSVTINEGDYQKCAEGLQKPDKFHWGTNFYNFEGKLQQLQTCSTEVIP